MKVLDTSTTVRNSALDVSDAAPSSWVCKTCTATAKRVLTLVKTYSDGVVTKESVAEWCKRCHGVDGIGVSPFSPSLTKALAPEKPDPYEIANRLNVVKEEVAELKALLVVRNSEIESLKAHLKNVESKRADEKKMVKAEHLKVKVTQLEAVVVAREAKISKLSKALAEACGMASRYHGKLAYGMDEKFYRIQSLWDMALPCVVSLGSSRVCERGTKGCKIPHPSEVPAPPLCPNCRQQMFAVGESNVKCARCTP